MSYGDRISIGDVRSMFGRLAGATEALNRHVHAYDPDTHRLVLSEGGTGRAFRVNLSGRPVVADDGTVTYPHGSGHSDPPFGPEWVGNTKREAWEFMAAVARTIEDAAYHLERAQRATPAGDRLTVGGAS